MDQALNSFKKLSVRDRTDMMREIMTGYNEEMAVYCCEKECAKLEYNVETLETMPIIIDCSSCKKNKFYPEGNVKRDHFEFTCAACDAKICSDCVADEVKCKACTNCSVVFCKNCKVNVLKNECNSCN
jgi:hypothetical protein